MVEELYDSHDYCLLAEELEALKAELAEVTADKERKVKYLEADYVISNRELLIKQAEIQRLVTELADWKADAERLAEKYGYRWQGDSYCVHCEDIGDYESDIEHENNCPITLHRELVAKYGGENNQADVCSGGENNQ